MPSIAFFAIQMISKKHLIFRAFLSGVLTLVLGVTIALCFPNFSATDFTLFGSYVLYIGEFIVVHLILWLWFRNKNGRREAFLYKNVVISEGWGAVAIVYVIGILANDNDDLLFPRIVGIVWAFVSVLWNVLEDQAKKNQEQQNQKRQQKPLTNKSSSSHNKPNRKSKKKRK